MKELGSVQWGSSDLGSRSFSGHPQGGMETPANLGAAFVRSTKPKPNCRMERATYEMTAGSGSPFVSQFVYFW